MHRRLYNSYLLRLWKDGPEPDWRASLQDIATGECYNFADLNGLYTFLQQETGLAIALQPGSNGSGELTLYKD